MKNLIAVAAAALTMSASGAVMAADLGVVVMDEPVMMSDPGFDWDGLYIGLKGQGQLSTVIVDLGGAAFVLGANGTVDSVLFGVEGWVGGFSSVTGAPAGLYAGASGRIGYLVTPDVVLYGSATVEHFFPAGGLTTFGFGGGAEFAMTDDLTLDVNYSYAPWTTVAGATAHTVSASLNYHF